MPHHPTTPPPHRPSPSNCVKNTRTPTESCKMAANLLETNNIVVEDEWIYGEYCARTVRVLSHIGFLEYSLYGRETVNNPHRIPELWSNI